MSRPLLPQPIEYKGYNPFTPSWPEHDLGPFPEFDVWKRRGAET